ncbi:MAG: hemolysin family protein [Chroococcales cyanobacterium]
MFSATNEILIILLLIILNGVLAMSELAIVSARKVRLEQLRTQGNRGARAALDLANNPNRILSTVQIGITLIGILAGAFSGATLAQKLAEVLDNFPAIAEHSEAIALAIVVLIVTYLSLVVGELVPKRLALNNPEDIATRVALPLRWTAILVAPVVHLLSWSTDRLLQLLGHSTTVAEPSVTEEEIKILLQQGTEAGTFEAAEQDMVERVFQLGDRKASALMTSRPEIVWLNLEDSSEVNRNKIINSSHTRFPICQNSLDEVLGIVQATDLLAHCLMGEHFDLTDHLRQPLFVPESTRGLKVLELFKKTGTHIALVVDEYGVIQGLVTLNDILEAIVGDIPSLGQQETPQAIQREDGSWLLDGILPIEEFRKLFEIEEFPGEQRGNYHTLGGFVITHLGHIPTATDHFQWNGLRFEVMDMDGNRVDKVLVMPVVEALLDRTNDVY